MLLLLCLALESPFKPSHKHPTGSESGESTRVIGHADVSRADGIVGSPSSKVSMASAVFFFFFGH